MKKIVGFLVFALFMTFSASAIKKTVTYKVSIDCNGCANKIKKHIPFEKGVKDLTVDMDTKQVTVIFDDKKTDVKQVQKALEKLDFKVSVVKEEEIKEKK